MLCGFTRAVHQKYQHIGRERLHKKKWMSEQFLWWKEDFYTAYSRIRSIDGHGSGKQKKIPAK